ncbi:MAG: aminotransferase class I/II-fold pyridoxal phosphate-dependent enzyme [Clostridia bacterium]|nr:aminotransferase class I/II-fold pyridoxal phosphate-dependent enzyme [Clostridia bacterium]
MKNPYIAKKHWEYELPPLSRTDEMAKRYDDIINLSVGDPDYPADKTCLDLMYRDALAGHTRYTEYYGDPELREETIKMYKEDYGVDVAMNELLITAGGTHALYVVMQTILDPGDEVIAIAPYYTYYKDQVEMAEGKLVVYNAPADKRFDVEVEELEKLVNSRTKAIIVNSPCNPSGKVYSRENLQAIMDLAEKYDFQVIADDIYGALNYTDNKMPLCTYEERPNRVITVYSYSKDFSATGVRLGHIIARSDIIDAALNVCGGVTFTICSFSQRFGLYALRRRKEIQEGLRAEYQKRMLYAYERISKLNHVKCFYPEGTFYIFADIRETGISSMDMWDKILDEAKVLVLPGDGFGKAGEGYIRICCTVSVEVLKEAFDRLEKMDIFK